MLPSGALIIDKPVGLTSSDVVSQLKWKLVNSGYAKKGFRIGHGGTLDPFATGVLIVFIGEATKLADTYLHSIKGYDGMIALGSETNSGDLTGERTLQKKVPKLSLSEWQRLAQLFVDEPYLQVPPMFSAKKRDGTPLHELARAGITIERDAILKKILEFEVTTTSDPHELYFKIRCESGTYVRVIAEDLAKKAATAAHLKILRRTRSSDVEFIESKSLRETLSTLDEKTPLTDLIHFRRFESLASHIQSFSVEAPMAERLWRGAQAEIQLLCQKCSEDYLDERYVIAKIQGVPLALFENLKDIKSFRLQRIFNEGRRED